MIYTTTSYSDLENTAIFSSAPHKIGFHISMLQATAVLFPRPVSFSVK